MLSEERNVFESKGWILRQVVDFKSLCNFDCGESDLNDYFQNDCQLQQKELLNSTFALTEATMEDFIPVALISLCNDSIKKEKIIKFLGFKDTKKEYPSYPAVKIARLGVNRQFQNQNIGTHLINMVKTMFVTNNRTGCRFLTVDAYNNAEVLKFYQKNGFEFFSNKDRKKFNRAMFFDLKRLELDDE